MKISQTSIAAIVFMVGLSLAPSCLAQPRGPVVMSPEVNADRKITFRILAPKAEMVQLASSGDIPGVGSGQEKCSKSTIPRLFTGKRMAATPGTSGWSI
jgi:hypothetical protein